MVYIMTNSVAENEIAAFRRFKDGTLALRDFFPTGGSGTGTREVSDATPNDGIDPLASQGSLILSRCGRFLFNVNAGSNTITSFRVMADGGLVRASVVNSGGLQPNSLTQHGNTLYVSNVGGSANNFASNITGFHVDRCGVLTMIPNSTRQLSTPNAQPARVLFSPSGRQLLVSELTTNRITVFSVNRNGIATLQMVNASNGAGPFGMVFVRHNLLLVAEAGANALSSYTLNENGSLTVISGSVPTGQQATCWVSVSRSGRFAYTSNTGSGTISVFRVRENGILTLLENVRSTPAGTPQGAPIDNDVSPNGRFFYALNGNQGTVSAFEIGENGRLMRIQVASGEGIPVFGTQGLAVR
jgi:6-phosphogluconolactonase (cycloisomerase 2 family)